MPKMQNLRKVMVMVTTNPSSKVTDRLLRFANAISVFSKYFPLGKHS